MEISQWQFGSERFQFTCVDFKDHSYLIDIKNSDIVSLTMAFENQFDELLETKTDHILWSFIVGVKLIIVNVNTDHVDQIKNDINQFIDAMGYTGKVELIPIWIHACDEEDFDNDSDFESNRPVDVTTTSKATASSTESIEPIVKTFAEFTRDFRKFRLNSSSLVRLWNSVYSNTIIKMCKAIFHDSN